MICPNCKSSKGLVYQIDLNVVRTFTINTWDKVGRILYPDEPISISNKRIKCANCNKIFEAVIEKDYIIIVGEM